VRTGRGSNECLGSSLVSFSSAAARGGARGVDFQASPDISGQPGLKVTEGVCQVVRAAGITPLIGGLEHARDIVQVMDRKRMMGADKSLGRFLQELQQVFKEWSKS
jgi:hypothetical protein